MSTKFRIFFIFLLAAWMQLTVSAAAGPEVDPYPALVLPVYPDAYDIENMANRSKGTRAVIYKIQTNFPAAEVLEFYDSTLNGSGWEPSFETCQRHWASLDDGSIKKGQPPRQMFTSWQHPQYKLQMSLLLEYHGPATSGLDEVHVQCRLKPQLDTTRREKFVARLKAAGQYRTFAEKLEAYRTPDGEIDPALIDRDIRNHRAGDIIIEYRRFLGEEQQQIEKIIRRVNESRQRS
jgi:hypothetical protein